METAKNPSDARPLVILGCGAQGRIIADVAKMNETPLAGFLVDGKDVGSEVNGVAVLGGFALATDAQFCEQHQFIVGLGDPTTRLHLSKLLLDRGATLKSVIHPAAHISPSAVFGRGIMVNAFSTVFPNAHVGDAVLIDNHASIGVDNRIGDGVFVGPAAQLNKEVVCGTAAFIGSGAVVIPHVQLGERCVIAAGATVTRDIPSYVLAVGTPARIVRSLNPELESSKSKGASISVEPTFV